MDRSEPAAHWALNDSHITALLDTARRRQAEPIDLADDDAANSKKSDE